MVFKNKTVEYLIGMVMIVCLAVTSVILLNMWQTPRVLMIYMVIVGMAMVYYFGGYEDMKLYLVSIDKDKMVVKRKNLFTEIYLADIDHIEYDERFIKTGLYDYMVIETSEGKQTIHHVSDHYEELKEVFLEY